MVDQLWAHQTECIKRAEFMKWYALHFEPGTGKTRTAIEILRGRFNASKRFYKTIIFCPQIVMENWKEEWLKYSKVEAKNICLLKGTGAQRVRLLQTTQAKIIILNYESLGISSLYKELLAWKPEVFILDEAHRMKSPTAERPKLMYDLVRFSQPQLVLELTGTSILNNITDLFMQFKCMMGGFPTEDYYLNPVPANLITNFFHFRGKYLEDRNARWKGSENYYPDYQPKINAKDDIAAILKTYSMSVEKEQCLDLPGEMDISIRCSLTKEQAADYVKMENDLVVQLEKGTSTAEIALVKSLRLMQITSGFLCGTEDDNTPIIKQYGKTERESALEELLKELCVERGSKVLVWAVWKHNYETIKRVCDKLEIKYVECHGGVSAKEKEEARKTFITMEGAGVWLGHPGSGGIGVNLVVAPYTIWYSRTYSLEQYEQARARNYRGGQTQKVTHYHLIAPETVEPDIVEALRNKQVISKEVLLQTRFRK